MSTYRPSVESPIPRDTYVLETDGVPQGHPGPSPFGVHSDFMRTVLGLFLNLQYGHKLASKRLVLIFGSTSNCFRGERPVGFNGFRGSPDILLLLILRQMVSPKGTLVQALLGVHKDFMPTLSG